MMYDKKQIVKGLINYIDNEVIPKLSTTGKWVLGTGITLMVGKAEDVLETLCENPLIVATGVVSDDGNIDITQLIDAMVDVAQKYGKMNLDIPMVGRLSFDASDINVLRRYMV